MHSNHHIDVSSSSSYGIPSFQQLCYTTINEYMDCNTIKFNQFYQILSDKKIINEKISNYYSRVSQACYYNTDAAAILQKKRMNDEISTTKIDSNANVHHHHHYDCYDEDLIYEQWVKPNKRKEFLNWINRILSKLYRKPSNNSFELLTETHETAFSGSI